MSTARQALQLSAGSAHQREALKRLGRALFNCCSSSEQTGPREEALVREALQRFLEALEMTDRSSMFSDWVELQDLCSRSLYNLCAIMEKVRRAEQDDKSSEHFQEIRKMLLAENALFAERHALGREQELAEMKQGASKFSQNKEQFQKQIKVLREAAGLLDKQLDPSPDVSRRIVVLLERASAYFIHKIFKDDKALKESINWTRMQMDIVEHKIKTHPPNQLPEEVPRLAKELLQLAEAKKDSWMVLDVHLLLADHFAANDDTGVRLKALEQYRHVIAAAEAAKPPPPPPPPPANKKKKAQEPPTDEEAEKARRDLEDKCSSFVKRAQYSVGVLVAAMAMDAARRGAFLEQDFAEASEFIKSDDDYETSVERELAHAELACATQEPTVVVEHLHDAKRRLDGLLSSSIFARLMRLRNLQTASPIRRTPAQLARCRILLKLYSAEALMRDTSGLHADAAARSLQAIINDDIEEAGCLEPWAQAHLDWCDYALLARPGEEQRVIQLCERVLGHSAHLSLHMRMQLYVNLCAACRTMPAGDPAEKEDNLKKAFIHGNTVLALFRGQPATAQAAFPRVWARVHAQLGLLLVDRRDDETKTARAVAMLSTAAELLATLTGPLPPDKADTRGSLVADTQLLVTVQCHLAKVCAASRKPADAASAANRALACARTTGDQRLRAEAALTCADIALQQEDWPAAHQQASEALVSANLLQQLEDGSAAWRRLATEASETAEKASLVQLRCALHLGDSENAWLALHSHLAGAHLKDDAEKEKVRQWQQALRLPILQRDAQKLQTQMSTWQKESNCVSLDGMLRLVPADTCVLALFALSKHATGAVALVPASAAAAASTAAASTAAAAGDSRGRLRVCGGPEAHRVSAAAECLRQCQQRATISNLREYDEAVQQLAEALLLAGSGSSGSSLDLAGVSKVWLSLHGAALTGLQAVAAAAVRSAAPMIAEVTLVSDFLDLWPGRRHPPPQRPPYEPPVVYGGTEQACQAVRALLRQRGLRGVCHLNWPISDFPVQPPTQWPLMVIEPMALEQRVAHFLSLGLADRVISSSFPIPPEATTLLLFRLFKDERDVVTEPTAALGRAQQWLARLTWAEAKMHLLEAGSPLADEFDSPRRRRQLAGQVSTFTPFRVWADTGIVDKALLDSLVQRGTAYGISQASLDYRRVAGPELLLRVKSHVHSIRYRSADETSAMDLWLLCEDEVLMVLHLRFADSWPMDDHLAAVSGRVAEHIGDQFAGDAHVLAGARGAQLLFDFRSSPLLWRQEGGYPPLAESDEDMDRADPAFLCQLLCSVERAEQEQPNAVATFLPSELDYLDADDDGNDDLDLSSECPFASARYSGAYFVTI